MKRNEMSQRCQNKKVQRIYQQPMRIVLLAVLIACGLLFSSCDAEIAQGKIKGAYQPLKSGMVQMYIEVELDANTKVSAWLPQDQELWDEVTKRVRSRKRLSVEIQRKRSKEYWEFVRFLDE